MFWKWLISKLLRRGTLHLMESVTPGELEALVQGIADVAVADLTERLVAVERKAEATRRKVYRDQDGRSGEGEEQEIIPQVTPLDELAALGPGQPIPVELLARLQGG